MTELPRARARPDGALPDGLAARRPGPHGALQLGVRPPPRRHVRVPHRGHRRGAQHPGVLRRPLRGDALARSRLGRGPRRRRRRSRRTARASARRSTPTPSSGCAGSSRTYDCYCTNDEVEARRKASGSKVMGYDGFCRELTDEQVAAFRAEGRQPVVRFRMPDGEITFDDLVRGEITFHTDHVPDFALARANGDPLYTLVNPVDDALMEITHVLRGEDLLSSTPRQVALYDALARGRASRSATPQFGHLPYVMGEGNKKLSKRDPEAHLLGYRDEGFLPEGLLNYLALLGWAIAEDRDVFTLRGDGRGLRHRAGQPQPGALRPQEGRGHQRRAHAAAQPRGDDRAGDAVPPGTPACSSTPSPPTQADAAGAGDAAGARADQQAHRGGRRCWASCSPTRSPTTPTDVGQGARRRRARRRRGGP